MRQSSSTVLHLKDINIVSRIVLFQADRQNECATPLDDALVTSCLHIGIFYFFVLPEPM